MTWQNKCIVKCTYHHFQNKNNLERVTFFLNDARYLTLGTFLLCRQCALLRCEQVCFGGAALLTNCQA